MNNPAYLTKYFVFLYGRIKHVLYFIYLFLFIYYTTIQKFGSVFFVFFYWIILFSKNALNKSNSQKSNS